MKLTFTSITSILLLAVLIGTGWTDVIWIEAEDFDEEKSVLESPTVNLTWKVISEEDAKGILKEQAKDAFGEKFLFADGAHNKTGSSGTVYEIPEIRGKRQGWVFWARRIMADDSKDSFFWDIRPDSDFEWGQKNADSRPEVSGPVQEWTWGNGGNFELDADKGNFLRISERESGFKIDLFCLRSDGLRPTDDEYQEYLETHPEGREKAVEPANKLSTTWGEIKLTY